MIDVPNKGFLKDMQQNLKLKQLLDDAKTTGIKAIVHFTPSEVFNTPEYQQFIESNDPDFNLIVNDSNK